MSCQVSDEFTSALTSRTKFSSFQRMGRSRQLLPSLAIASGVLVRQVQGKVDQPAHSHSHPPPQPFTVNKPAAGSAAFLPPTSKLLCSFVTT